MNAATEVVHVKPAGAVSAMERAMQKHNVGTPPQTEEDQKLQAMMNMTYQEVPSGGINDEELKQDEQHLAKARQTERLPDVVYDESLFLDKIKEFNPQSMQNDEPSVISEEDEAVEEFDITQVEQDRSGGAGDENGNNGDEDDPS